MDELLGTVHRCPVIQAAGSIYWTGEDPVVGSPKQGKGERKDGGSSSHTTEKTQHTKKTRRQRGRARLEKGKAKTRDLEEVKSYGCGDASTRFSWI